MSRRSDASVIAEQHRQQRRVGLGACGVNHERPADDPGCSELFHVAVVEREGASARDFQGELAHDEKRLQLVMCDGRVLPLDALVTCLE